MTPDGVITTVAGGGTNASGEDILATEAAIVVPGDVAVDDIGNLYFTESFRLHRIGPGGLIRTIAGDNQPIFGGPPRADIGDGGPATAAKINPSAIAFDTDGALLIADNANGRIRRLAPNGTISSVLGGGRGPYDSGPPAQLDLISPSGLAVAPDGTKFVMMFWGLLRVPSDGSNVVQITGREDRGLLDGRPANASMILSGGPPQGIAVDPHGNVFIADSRRYRLRRIGPDGTLYVSDMYNYRIRAIK